MRPELDASTSVQGAAVSSLTSPSWTVASKDNRCMVAHAGTAASAPPAISTVKWGGAGGVDLTKQGADQTFSTNHRNTWWRLLNPVAQTSTTVATFASTADEAFLNVSTWSRVHQTTPHGTDVRATGASAAPPQTATVGVTPITHESVTLSFVFGSNNGGGTSLTLLINPDELSIEEQESIDLFIAGGMGYRGGGKNAMNATSWVVNSNVNVVWGIIAVELNTSDQIYYSDVPAEILLHQAGIPTAALLTARAWFGSSNQSLVMPNWFADELDESVAAVGGTRGIPFGNRGVAFNGGRTFIGPIN